MANINELVDITKNILINNELVCELLQSQNHYFAAQKINNTVSLLGKFIDKSTEIVPIDVLNELILVLQEISATQETKDYVLLSDLFELKLHPLMSEIQKAFISGDNLSQDSLPSGYTLEYTNIGALTLNVNNIYLHSNGDPYKEARRFAKEYCETDIIDYSVFGIGLGYHILAMLEYDERYHIVVHELDSNMLNIAQKFNDFSKYIEQGRLTLKHITNPDCINPEYIPGKHKYIIHYPSLLIAKDNICKTKLSDYFIKLSSVQAHNGFLRANFYYNQQLKDKYIDSIKEHFYGKTIIYAGGGPSLQKRLDEVRELSSDQNTLLVCAGTVYRQLLNQNIIPDYVIITDPAKALVNQIKDCPETKTVMLYLSTASKEAVSIFNGKRYIVYQEGYEEAEKLAAIKGYTTFDTGGSVSTTAIDIALRYKCNKLICIGLDLAFTDNKRHAFGIGGSVTSDEGLLSVTAVDGGYIKTSNNLNIYRKWIEKRISGISDIPLINMSRGAKINGMIDM